MQTFLAAAFRRRSSLCHRFYAATPRTPAAELRPGRVVETDAGALAVVTRHTYTQGAGRQAGNVQAVLRDLRTSKTSSVRWRPDTPVVTPRLEEAEVDVLYRDGDDLHVMDAATYEQSTLPVAIVGVANPALITDGARLIIQSPPGGGAPVSATPADATATLTVVDVPTRIGAASSYLPATCEGGVTVGVPEYVKPGDRIIVSVADGEFVKRA